MEREGREGERKREGVTGRVEKVGGGDGVNMFHKVTYTYGYRVGIMIVYIVFIFQSHV